MLPTHMHLNGTFMRSTGNWATPDYPTEGGQVCPTGLAPYPYPYPYPYP